MANLRIGVIAEGITDHIVIESLLKAYCTKNNLDVELDFIRLQPSSDGTSGSREGGWRLVYQWCKGNPPAVRRSTYLGRPLFANGLTAKKCDLLIVHLDGDCCEQLGSTSLVVPKPPPAPNAVGRGEYIRATIQEWLWPDPNDLPDNLHIPAPAVEAIETWLIAAFDNDPDPENILDVSARFAAVYYPAIGRKIPLGVKEVKKNETSYKRFLEKCPSQIDSIVNKCSHFRYLTAAIFS
jgi:hypothetical protein